MFWKSFFLVIMLYSYSLQERYLFSKIFSNTYNTSVKPEMVSSSIQWKERTDDAEHSVPCVCFQNLMSNKTRISPNILRCIVRSLLKIEFSTYYLNFKLINPFVPNAFFLYPLKTSKNLGLKGFGGKFLDGVVLLLFNKRSTF